MKTLGIIGGGLFGRVAAAHLQLQGWDVTVFDHRAPLRASQCAGCLFKPSWLSGLKDWEAGAELLYSLYGVNTLELATLVGAVSVHRVQPADILNDERYPCVEEPVVQVNWAKREVWTPAEKHTFDAVYLASGIDQSLLPVRKRVSLTQRMGMTLYFTPPEGHRYARLKVWAPYKQAVSIPLEDATLGPVVWFGDGTSLKAENWQPRHTLRAREHALEFGLEPRDTKEVRYGIRPMYGKTGHFARIAPGCYHGTGGGKNGVVLAALFALRLAAQLEGK